MSETEKLKKNYKKGNYQYGIKTQSNNEINMSLFNLNLEGSRIILIKEDTSFSKCITGKINCGDIYPASIMRLSDNQGSLASKREG